MKELAISRSIRLMCAGTIAMSMQVAGAQTAAEPVQKVLVTGSRIYSPGADSPAPMQVLSAADIAASGATNVQELLLKNPTMGTPTLSRTNSNFLTTGNGVATIDLRNLGSQRTLVLINGRRMVAGTPGSSEVDLNTIPTDFIERIELLTGGASATYGSDAVAGVVNIILKKKFTGFVFDSSYGKSEKGDDTKKKIGATFGTSSADGASNVMAHVGYSRQGAVFSRDREMSAIDQTTLAASTRLVGDVFKVKKPAYSGYIPAGTFIYGDGPTLGSYTYDASGNPIPVSTNGSATQAPTGYNRSAGRYIAVPVERMLFSSTGNFALGENHTAFFEGMYAATKASSLIEPLPFDSEGPYPIDGRVPAEFNVNGAMVRNPLVPQYLWDRLTDVDEDGARDYYFTRRMSDIAVRSNKAERDTFRLLGGVKGALGGSWNYEAYYAYGSTKEAQTGTGGVNVLNFRNALEAIPDGNGGAMCRDATARQQGCVPINIFGANKVSPAAAKYVGAPSILATKTTQKLAGASVSGEAFKLPAGAVGIAAGAEWRAEEAATDSDILTQLGLNGGNATPNTNGKFSVKEFFVEARVPLLKDQPFAKSLSLLSAARVGDYTTVGKTESWNIGFEWAPIADVRLRATRALSTRAPNINELYSPPSQTFPAVDDPCLDVTATSTGAISVACRAAPGVNANIAANGKFTLNQSDVQGVSGYDRGNPLVQEEKGRSTTFGVVYTPRSIPMLSKFTFTADYFDIKIAGAIVGTPRDYTLKNCYGGDGTMCGFITRRPAAIGVNSAGSISYIDSAVSNSGGLSTEGVDVTGSWADNVGPGRLNARVAYTYVKTNDTRPLPDAPIDPFAGEVGGAKHKSSIILGYKIGAFNIVSNTQTISRSCIDDQYLANLKTAPDVPASPGVPAVPGPKAGPCSASVKAKIYNDFQLSYQVKKQVELYVGIDNAFDTKAPLIPSGVPGNNTGVETNAGTYDPIGRRWYAGLRVSM
jgi:iron complex outermembrane receptor protein